MASALLILSDVAAAFMRRSPSLMCLYSSCDGHPTRPCRIIAVSAPSISRRLKFSLLLATVEIQETE